jgi:hypothetical protein
MGLYDLSDEISEKIDEANKEGSAEVPIDKLLDWQDEINSTIESTNLALDELQELEAECVGDDDKKMEFNYVHETINFLYEFL